MADTSFPAHLSVDRQLDIDGVPILTASVSVSDDVAALPLPAGPAGAQGQRGRPRSTFRKMGEIPNQAARPTGLNAEDRGKWWHRLDDNGMDVWTGTAWKHSPGAVGARGPVADANQITTAPTKHLPDLTTPALEFIGAGAQQQLNSTAPAGAKGAKGPAGASGQITKSTDFDQTSGLTHGGVFAYQRSSGKFRGMPTPLAVGPWSWYESDFSGDQEGAVAQFIAGTFTIPAQPFAWRPVVYGHMSTYSVNNGQQSARGAVRLYHSQGQVVGATAGGSGVYLYSPITPTYRDEQSTRTLSPTSDFAVVPAGQAASLVVAVERDTGNGAIGYRTSRASLVVYARPI
ncbi:hypothetical protein GFY24_01640 [Nocardia sp. SYP-A9097]|uniref:hypothetical protein n=1 Tax=Nocardia sp. SYP-A9097 TaxID=2663237 RepID=UPI00129A6A3A|nr:hypothetical protein [Nocardia sp. SYP-A9097]MRH86178.1 hypothetical protein [Nocardia sp. SYP-A9097]